MLKTVAENTMTKRVAVTSNTSEKWNCAETLASQLNLPLIPWSEDFNLAYDYLLVVNSDYIGLQSTHEKRFLPFYIDFISGRMRYRSSQAGLRSELLARAIGCKPRDNHIIVDTTTGLGRDSFILATLGFNVIALERSPIIHTLLCDALERAKAIPSTAPIAKRIQLFSVDAINWLQTNPADVIYLDPMFPERQKSASVKKEMVILQDLLGKDTDASALLEMALSCASKRVVVKRPRLATTLLTQPQPDFEIEGKSSRFDVYLTSLSHKPLTR